MSLLTKIREKPENQKRVFSFVSAGVLTALILVVWLSFSDTSANKRIENEDKLSSLSPMQVIKEEFSKAFSSFKEQTDGMSSDEIATSTRIE